MGAKKLEIHAVQTLFCGRNLAAMRVFAKFFTIFWAQLQAPVKIRIGFNCLPMLGYFGGGYALAIDILVPPTILSARFNGTISKKFW